MLYEGGARWRGQGQGQSHLCRDAEVREESRYGEVAGSGQAHGLSRYARISLVLLSLLVEQSRPDQSDVRASRSPLARRQQDRAAKVAKRLREDRRK